MNSLCGLNPNNSDSIEMRSYMIDLKEDKARNYCEIFKPHTDFKSFRVK